MAKLKAGVNALYRKKSHAVRIRHEGEPCGLHKYSSPPLKADAGELNDSETQLSTRKKASR